MDELRITSANPTDREVEILLLSVSKSVKEKDDNLEPNFNMKYSKSYTMFEAFGKVDDMESMHLLFQFFFVFSLLLNCRLSLYSDVAE